jgi:hypothetical protein
MMRRVVPIVLGKLLMILRIPVSEEYGNILAGPEASVRVIVRTELYSGKLAQGYKIESSRRMLAELVDSQD